MPGRVYTPRCRWDFFLALYGISRSFSNAGDREMGSVRVREVVVYSERKWPGGFVVMSMEKTPNILPV